MHHEGSRRIFPMARLPEFSEPNFGEPRTYELRRTPLAHSFVRKAQAPDRLTNASSTSGSWPRVAERRTFGALSDEEAEEVVFPGRSESGHNSSSHVCRSQALSHQSRRGTTPTARLGEPD